MIPGLELTACTDLAVPREVMQHVVQVESSFNPFAIGVVGGRLQRQPKTLDEALATVKMLEEKGYNFSVGIAQVNRYNLGKYGLGSYAEAFEVCPNLRVGSRILAECYGRSKRDWGKAFSCYYSGNFVTGYRHGYVQKVYASMKRGGMWARNDQATIAVVGREGRKVVPVERFPLRTASVRVEQAGSDATTTAAAPAPAAPPSVAPPAVASPVPASAPPAAATPRTTALPTNSAGFAVPTATLSAAPPPSTAAPPQHPGVDPSAVHAGSGRDEAFVF